MNKVHFYFGTRWSFSGQCLPFAEFHVSAFIQRVENLRTNPVKVPLKQREHNVIFIVKWWKNFVAQ